MLEIANNILSPNTHFQPTTITIFGLFHLNDVSILDTKLNKLIFNWIQKFFSYIKCIYIHIFLLKFENFYLSKLFHNTLLYIVLSKSMRV